MSKPTHDAEGFALLLDAACDGELDDVQTDELFVLLDADSALCEAFAQHVQLRTDIRLLCRANRACEGGLAQVKATLPGSTSSALLLGGMMRHSPGLFLTSGWPVAYLIATIIFGIGALIGAFTYVSSPGHVALQGNGHRTPASAVVGRITGVMDGKWSEPSNPPALDHVVLGQEYSLASGFLQMTYDSGATVLLEGPAKYTVNANDGGYLAFGKLTARVEKKAEEVAGGQWPVVSESKIPSLSTLHSPLFTIRTPTAIVTDLGTEFGVEVDRTGRTSSHVFRGVVRVEAIRSDGSPGDAKVLRANQSAHVEQTDGQGVVTLVASGDRVPPFVRELPKKTVRFIDLVDIVAGGDGLGHARNRGIDPQTGRITTNPRGESPDDLRWARYGDGQLHKVDGMPLVDGVFIPIGAHGPTQLDSAGHTFEDFITSENCMSGCAWAGSYVPNDPDARTTYFGVDYASPGHGLLAMCANQGITFDLDTIRQAHPNGRIARFVAVAANTETASAWGKEVSADVWVFVDGQVRKKMRNINAFNCAIPIDIPLAAGDRFLTLATTDGNDSIDFDWIMFGDPRLELEETHTDNAAR